MQNHDSKFFSAPDTNTGDEIGLDWNNVFTNDNNDPKKVASSDDVIDFSPQKGEDTRDRFIVALFGDDEKNAETKDAPQDKRVEPRPAPQEKPGPVEQPQLDKLNPKFKTSTTRDLTDALEKNLKSLATIKDRKSPEFGKIGAECVEAYQELIARSDYTLDSKAFTDSLQAVPQLQNALMQGKELTVGKDGKKAPGDVDLTPEKRWQYHMAVFNDLQIMGEQIQQRDRFVELLKFLGNAQDAEKVSQEAEQLRNRMAKPVDVDGKKISANDLIKTEAKQLENDKAVYKNDKEKVASADRGISFLLDLTMNRPWKEPANEKSVNEKSVPDAENKERGPDLKRVMAILNPKFKEKSNEEIQDQLIKDTDLLTKSKDIRGPESVRLMEDCKEAYEELIKRIDLALDPKEFEQATRASQLLLECMQNGKDIKEGPDGKRVMSDEPLSVSRRWLFHTAVFGDLEVVNRQIQIRQEYARFLTSAHQNKDAEQMLIAARDVSERLLKPIDMDGKKISLMDILKQESKQLRDDLPKFLDPEKRQVLQQGQIFLLGADANSGLMKAPINLNKSLAEFYLAPEYIPEVDEFGRVTGLKEVRFGTSNALKPQKSYEAAIRAKENIKTVYGDGPVKQDVEENVGLLFAGLADILDNPKQFDLYKTDEKGVPLFISQFDADKLREDIRSTSKSYSFLVDAGVWALGSGALALTRNPKILARMEKGAVKVGTESGVKSFLKTTGKAATLITGATLVRNYGIEKLTGEKEDLLDSTKHAVGSLALSVLTLKGAKAAEAFQPFKSPAIDSAIRRSAGVSLAGGVLSNGISPTEIQKNVQLRDLLKKTQEPIENKK
ncbi:MAG: hypothetical protein K2X93_26450 [Candidatus Obscuribacterales bacterium]|nr:hypothetical protein [Candidatus Obscuribacterales bacterium]